VQGAQPRLNVGSDARAQGDELALQPGLEGWGAIVVEHADVVEDLDGPLDAELITAQNGEQFGEADLVTVSMARQQNDQCPVDVTTFIAGQITPTWSDPPTVVAAAEIESGFRGREHRSGHRPARRPRPPVGRGALTCTVAVLAVGRRRAAPPLIFTPSQRPPRGLEG
jgi:hypothetical protein